MIVIIEREIQEKKEKEEEYKDGRMEFHGEERRVSHGWREEKGRKGKLSS